MLWYVKHENPFNPMTAMGQIPAYDGPFLSREAAGRHAVNCEYGEKGIHFEIINEKQLPRQFTDEEE